MFLLHISITNLIEKSLIHNACNPLGITKLIIT